MLIGVVYGSYIRPVITYGSEAWCLKEGVMAILGRIERSMERAMCGVPLKARKRSTDLMFILGLSGTKISWLWQTVFIGMVIC